MTNKMRVNVRPRPNVSTLTSLVMTLIDYIFFSYSSWSNQDYPMPNGRTFTLEIPNFSQSNLTILRFVDKPEFCKARLWKVVDLCVKIATG